VFHGSRPVRRIDLLQRGDELGQVARRLAGIGKALERRAFTCEPLVHRPGPRIALAGRADRHLHWNSRRPDSLGLCARARSNGDTGGAASLHRYIENLR
jgi:hypothetical protein